MKEILIAVSLVVVLLTGPLLAQPVNEKADDIINRVPFSLSQYHSQAGQAYRRHARDHVRFMRERFERDTPMRREMYREHTHAVRMNLDNSLMHQTKMEESMSKDAKTDALVASVKEHNTKAKLASYKLAKEAEKEMPDATVISQCCDEIEKELSLLENMEEQLAQKLTMSSSHPLAANTTAAKAHTVAKPITTPEPAPSK